MGLFLGFTVKLIRIGLVGLPFFAKREKEREISAVPVTQNFLMPSPNGGWLYIGAPSLVEKQRYTTIWVEMGCVWVNPAHMICS
jgi:hypothetical protein